MSIQNGDYDGSIKVGEYFLRFEKEEKIEEFYTKIALNELRETEDVLISALKKLKTMISDDKNFNLPIDDNVDLYLLAYLRSCKFYEESSLKKIQLMCLFKEKHPEYFANIVPRTEKNVFSKNIPFVVPERDQHGRRLLLLQMGKFWKPNECSLAEIIRGTMLIIEGAILEPRTQIAGTVLIIDFNGFGLQQALQFTPSFAKILVDWLQDAMPLRLKAIHLVSQPYIFNMVFAIFKPFMRAKLRSRIYFHGNDRVSLFKHIDVKYLPAQYGGKMKVPLDRGLDQWNLLCRYKDEYEKTSSFSYKF